MPTKLKKKGFEGTPVAQSALDCSSEKAISVLLVACHKGKGSWQDKASAGNPQGEKPREAGFKRLEGDLCLFNQ